MGVAAYQRLKSVYKGKGDGRRRMEVLEDRLLIAAIFQNLMKFYSCKNYY